MKSPAPVRARPLSRWVHSWRDTERWQQLVAETLKQRPLCEKCKRQRRLSAAVDVVHIKPSGGKKELFFDPANVLAVCCDHRGR